MVYLRGIVYFNNDSRLYKQHISPFAYVDELELDFILFTEDTLKGEIDMGQTDLKFVDQRLRARIKKSDWSNSWYHNLVGKRFEVERNPLGIKLIETEAIKVRELLKDSIDTAYYIKENECSVIRF